MSRGTRKFVRRCLAEARAQYGYGGRKIVTRGSVNFRAKQEEVVSSLLRHAQQREGYARK